MKKAITVKKKYLVQSSKAIDKLELLFTRSAKNFIKLEELAQKNIKNISLQIEKEQERIINDFSKLYEKIIFTLDNENKKNRRKKWLTQIYLQSLI